MGDHFRGVENGLVDWQTYGHFRGVVTLRMVNIEGFLLL